jgi:hypothetical protein
MPFILYIDDTCPKCGKPIWQTTIDRHPSHPDLAIHNYHCADCGPVTASVVSLKPGKSAGELAA